MPGLCFCLLRIQTEGSTEEDSLQTLHAKAGSFCVCDSMRLGLNIGLQLMCPGFFRTPLVLMEAHGKPMAILQATGWFRWFRPEGTTRNPLVVCIGFEALVLEGNWEITDNKAE